MDTSFEIIRDGAFRSDAALFDELPVVAGSSYENPRDALRYGMDRCSTLYLARNSNGEALSFYLVNWESLQLDNGARLKSIYTGLCATRTDYKNTGVAGELYFRFGGDCRKMWEESEEPWVMWGITASPIGWILGQRMQVLFGEFEPNPDLSYSEYGEKIARAIFKQMGWATTSKVNHPFVAVSAAPGRFNKNETRRLEAICREQGITVFDDLAIDPEKGDRLLFFCFRR